MEQLQSILLSHGYDLRNYAGDGATSQCYIVYSSKYKTDFVCKIIKPQEHTTSVFSNEINALVNLDHPNVIRCYDHFCCEGVYFLILEFCTNGTLQQLIESQPEYVKKCAVLYTKQIISGLEYCHKKGITHLDIKPHNILIDSYWRCKISDFGLSYQCHPGDDASVFLKKRGSLAYMAPEVLKNKDGSYNPFKADVWSLGMTIFRIAKGEAHMMYNNLSKQWREVYVESFEFKILGAVIQNCLIFSPEERPSVSEIMEILNYKEAKSEESKKCGLNSPKRHNSPPKLNSPKRLNSPPKVNSPNGIMSPTMLKSPKRLNSTPAISAQTGLKSPNSIRGQKRLNSTPSINSPVLKSPPVGLSIIPKIASPSRVLKKPHSLLFNPR